MEFDVFSNALFEAFSESNSSICVYVTDMNTGVSRWSRNSVSYFGLPGEYIQDSLSVWLEHIHPHDREIFMNDMNGVMNGTASRHFCQYRARNIKGEYVWVECRGKVINFDKEHKLFTGMLSRIDSQNAYDALTGLKTKTLFYEYDFCHKKGYAILLGIDQFRQIIGTYGYDKGDEIIEIIGRTMLEANNSSYQVYKFNGDEFLFIIPDSDRQQVEFLFHKGVEAFEKITLKNGATVRLTFTVSAVEFPFENCSVDIILDRLEATIAYAKKEHRGELVFYSSEIQEKENRLNLLKKELSESIADNFKGFELYFQPWMDNDGKDIVGCEALLRWKGETIKDSNPMEFIPILEESDEIIKVGQFVMEEAMKQQKEWEEKYKRPFLVSFNVSYSQFLVEGYAKNLEETARKYGVDPAHMVIELTESCSVQAPKLLASVFKRLRQFGFKLALDDFGTGYASLEMFRILPSDGVKIDHSFVRELSKDGHDVDLAIISSILTMCEKVGQKVVVEGVENEEVNSIIKEMNAGYLQGYYYSKPVCKDDFEKLLENKKTGLSQ